MVMPELSQAFPQKIHGQKFMHKAVSFVEHEKQTFCPPEHL